MKILTLTETVTKNHNVNNSGSDTEPHDMF